MLFSLNVKIVDNKTKAVLDGSVHYDIIRGQPHAELWTGGGHIQGLGVHVTCDTPIDIGYTVQLLDGPYTWMRIERSSVDGALRRAGHHVDWVDDTPAQAAERAAVLAREVDDRAADRHRRDADDRIAAADQRLSRATEPHERALAEIALADLRWQGRDESDDAQRDHRSDP